MSVNIDLDWQGWFVVATLACAFLIMAFDQAGPDLVFTILLAIYTTAGIVPVATAATGYSNTGLLTVIFLYLVAEGINQTGGLERIMTSVLGRSRSPFIGLIRMMIPCMILSAFLNNTPIVALLVPVIIAWCRRSGIPIKKMLMPLSIAAVLGGTITLIGTSTNLVVSGAQQTRYAKTDPANAQFRIFDIAPYGIPYAIWGFLFVIFMERYLLPGNSSRFETNLLLALQVGSRSPVAGQSLEASGLRKAYALKIAGIVRNKDWINASLLDPDFQLLEGDIIYIIGEFDNVEYYSEELGLDLYSSKQELSGSGRWLEGSLSTYTNLIQVNVQPTSSLIGTPLLSANLGPGISVYGVGRGKARKDGPLSDHIIAANDILILDASNGSDITGSAFLSDFKEVHEIKAGLAKVFIIQAFVTGGDVAGHTVSGAGLRGIPGITVLALDPKGDLKSRQEPVPYTSVVTKGDTLWIAADLTGVALLSRFPGLEYPQQQQITKTGAWFQWFQGKAKSGSWLSKLGFASRWLNQYYVDSDLLEQYFFTAVLSSSSAYVGQSVLDINLRSKINGALFAIHREGVRHPLHASSTVLQAGDSLLIGAPATFGEAQKHNNNFLSLSRVPNSNPPKKNRGTLSMLLGLALVISQIVPGVMSTTWTISVPGRKATAPIVTTEWIHLWPCAVLTAAFMLITGCLTGDQARASILWDVYLAIGGAFGVSATMERTNVAYEFAQIFIIIGKSIGGRGAGLTAIYVATALLSEILTNNASGAIMYPIAAIAGDKLGIEPRAMSIAIMLGASAGFINPFSYQTNMMVYAAGNYRFIEFVKFGTPFQLYLLVVAGFILSFYDDWKKVWIVSFIAMAAIILPPLLWSVLPERFTRPINLWIERKITFPIRAYFSKGEKVPSQPPVLEQVSSVQVKDQL